MNARIAARCRGSQGLTLVEVMVAFSILTMMFVGLLASFGMGKRAAAQGVATMNATHYARSVMESLRAYGYHDPKLSVGAHSVSGGSYVVTVTGGFQDTKDISLEVNWVEPGVTRTSTVTLATSVSEAMRD